MTVFGGNLRPCAFAAIVLLAGCVSSPTSSRRPFAPATILRDPSRFEQYSAFSPDGSEYYVPVSDSRWNYIGILRSVRNRGAWSAYSPLGFAWGKGRDAGEPFVSPDGERLFFVSARGRHPTVATGVAGSQDEIRAVDVDIFVATRSGSGWSEPVRLSAPVNSTSNEWRPSVAADGTLYFASERDRSDGKADIYAAPVGADGSYRAVRRLPPPVNLPDANDSDPFIAPDGSYLIFHSDRAESFGEHDLYISFAEPDGGWSQPRNLGPRINSREWEMGPFVTSDGRLLLFTRRAAIHTDRPSRIYAVDARAITRR